MTIEQNRLTPADLEAIAARAVDVAAMWRRSSTTGATPADPGSILALMRTGAAAIGCGLVDLRESELEELERIALEAIRKADQ